MLRLARRDLKALCGMMDPQIFEEPVFGFHAQQVVEKGLKAWLSAEGIEYPRIHDIQELVALLAERGARVPGAVSRFTDLTDYAVQFRYELWSSDEGELDRAELAGEIGALVEHVARLIESV